jgi:hypothetical protein
MGEKSGYWPVFKHWLKLGRWRMRRWVSEQRWGKEELAKSPTVLGNAMPKSGSHLIIQVLQGLTHLGPFVNPGFPPVNRTEDNRKLPLEAVLANIHAMRPGDIGYGYLQAREPFIEAVNKPGKAMVFVYRDPRDMIVSHVFYATEMHRGHGMHRYYTEVLRTMEQRICAAIEGVDEEGVELSNIKEKYERYLGWLQIPGILSLRFEDLILDRDNALVCLLNYLEQRGFSPKMTQEQSVLALKKAIAPSRSGTFRKGKPGNWREYFTPANKTLFKEVAGNLLIALGYEKDNGW